MANHDISIAEVWAQIPSIPTHEVSDRGRVRRTVSARNWQAGKILSPQLCKKGYLWVEICGYNRSIHSLVCEAFNGPRKPGQICRHLNDKKDDIRPGNLAWGTHQQNVDDAKRNGRRGGNKRRFDPREASRLRSMGMTTREIGFRLKVSHTAIANGLKQAAAGR